MIKFVVVLVLASCAGCFYQKGYARPKASLAEDQWRIYYNDRFEYQICYPRAFIPQGEADNGDGQVFVARDGARLRVYGSYSINVINQGDFSKEVTSINRSLLGRTGKMTYDRRHQEWAVSSGFNEKGQIFYMKSIKGTKDQIIVFILTYPPLLKNHYNQFIPNLVSCFKESH